MQNNRKIKVTLIKYAPHPNRGEFCIGEIINSAFVKIDGYSWTVGEYIGGETAQKLAELPYHEITVRSANFERK